MPSPVAEAGAFGTIARTMAMPILRRQLLGAIRGLRLFEAVVAPDREHVAASVRLDQPTQPVIAAIDTIAGYSGASAR
ncbi:MAG: hypothetical protein ACR2PF_08030, partial [Rhizobiaceae bacterium]